MIPDSPGVPTTESVGSAEPLVVKSCRRSSRARVSDARACLALEARFEAELPDLTDAWFDTVVLEIDRDQRRIAVAQTKLARRRRSA